MFVKGPKFSRTVGITPIMEAEQVRVLLDSIPVTRKVKVPKKHGGGLGRLRTSRGCATGPSSPSWRTPSLASAPLWAQSAATTAWRESAPGYACWRKEARKSWSGCTARRKSFWMRTSPLLIDEAEAPLFQTLDKAHRLTGDAITRRDMLRVVKDRCVAAGLSETFCNHAFRGTGMTVFLSNGGSLEAAQDMANHADPRTTKLYDRRKDLASLTEIERRIAFE
jgi:Phage integrase family